MPVYTPEELTTWTHGEWVGSPPPRLTGFVIDSREAKPGDCFVAIRTERRDGHDFLAAAQAGGAVAALVARPVVGVSLPQLVVADPVAALQACARAQRKRFRGPVIGITGSAGKTSTKDLLKKALGEKRVHATEGNLNNFLGVPLTLLALDPAAHDCAIIEAGINQPGEMALLADLIRPDVGVVTNVGAAHLAGLGSLSGVAAEKVQLLRATAADGLRVFPASCEVYPEFRDLPEPKAVLSMDEPGAPYYFQTKRIAADRSAANAEPASPCARTANPVRIELRLDLPGEAGLRFSLPDLSPGLCQNAALVATVARHLGASVSAVAAALESASPSTRRGEILECGPQTFYLDCYNANPLSMADALAQFDRRFSHGRRLFVLGSMGELGAEADTAHHALGASLPLRADDTAFFIGDGAEAMCAGARSAGVGEQQLRVFVSTDDAAAAVADFGGVIFLKGSRRFHLETLIPTGEVASC